jgi:hypothetical protein
MRLLFFLLISSLFIWGCKNEKPSMKKSSFKTFDFSYSDVFSTTFSIKFTSGDTVYINQHFAREDSRDTKSNTTYFSTLSDSDRNKLDSFVKATNFSRFDTLYWQNYEDGLSFQFYFENEQVRKLIRIHSEDIPRQLNTLSLWLVDMKMRLRLHEIDSTIKFESLNRFLPPPIKVPPNVEFVTPKVIRRK